MPLFPIVTLMSLAGVGYYVILPQLSYDNFGLTVFLLVLSVGYAVFGVGRLQYKASANRYASSSRDERETSGSYQLLPVIVLFVVGVCQVASSLPILRSSAYYQLLGEEKTKEFKAALPPIDEHNAPLVSYNMALRAAEKKLSEVTALGSQAQVGHLQKQRINGHLYWVAFLEHRGFFPWFSQGSTPGYVRVSATDPTNVELVTHLQGKSLKLRYLTSGYFGDNAERMLRFSGYATSGLTDFSPEIDDEGTPYMVVTVFDRKVGTSGHNATGVVVLDVQSGEHKFYAVNDVPAWVDRVQPHQFVEEQIDDRLNYVHGWFNPSQKDKLAIAGEIDVVYGKDGQAYFYAGITSTGGDGGTVGFMLVNTRTKEAMRFALVGVTEKVAQSAAEGVLPEKKYTATNALPFMVDGTTPAYVMALQDATGIARAYAIVDLTDYQRLAVADTLPAAVRMFQSRAKVDRTSLDPASRPSETSIKAKVSRISSEVRQGNSSYVLVLDGQSGTLFSADINRSDELSVTREGDMVEITTLVNNQHVLPVLVFHNLTMAQGTSPKEPTKVELSKK